jgi:RNA polymerase sigma-70 factor (ECF subfamily)
VSSIQEWRDDAGGLRRFGLALARDDRFVCDDVCAAALVDQLFRQASLTLVRERRAGARPTRARAFAQFVRLYRRHVRRLAAADADGGWTEGPPARRANGSATAAVRALPLELRETLLLVVLAGLTHAEAAEALDIPLAVAIGRLARARARVAAHMAAGSAQEPAAWPRAAHLRIVK